MSRNKDKFGLIVMLILFVIWVIASVIILAHVFDSVYKGYNINYYGY